MRVLRGRNQWPLAPNRKMTQTRSKYYVLLFGPCVCRAGNEALIGFNSHARPDWDVSRTPRQTNKDTLLGSVCFVTKFPQAAVCVRGAVRHGTHA